MANEKKIPMPEQEGSVRNKNFLEVALGYTPEQAAQEAGRCHRCKNKPCSPGCPVGVDIPSFIECIANEDFDGAFDVISASNSLPSVCGRVCPQENQCKKLCIRGIKGEPVAIGRLERFAGDFKLGKKSASHEEPQADGKKVAVIGSGPAGLSCAGELIGLGYSVTVFEALHAVGGVLIYGIPEFRLPKKIVDSEVSGLAARGVRFMTNAVVGRTFTIDELFEQGYEAVFLGTGAGLPSFMNIPGEGLIGVYSANEYLTRINLMKACEPGSKTPVLFGKKVAVVGGGNVAMDAARCAKRMGADEVTIVYRRAKAQMPARREEVHHAEEEGIAFKFLTAPVSLHPDENGRVASMTCCEMELGEPDGSGRRRPVVKENSLFEIETDCVVSAIGTSPNPLVAATTPGLETNEKGCVVTNDETCETSREGVFAGGDLATGAATVILAMGAGKRAARSIDRYMKSKTDVVSTSKA